MCWEERTWLRTFEVDTVFQDDLEPRMNNALFSSVAHKPFKRAQNLQVHNLLYQKLLIPSSVINSQRGCKYDVYSEYEKILYCIVPFKVLKVVLLRLKSTSMQKPQYLDQIRVCNCKAS